MCLQSVPSIGGFLDPMGQGHVDRVPFLPHLIGAGVQHTLDLIAHVLGGSTLTLRSLNVVITELSPGFWHRNTKKTYQWSIT